jgi:thiamine-phosphate pyrophosphorylase
VSHSHPESIDWRVYVILDPARMHDAFELREMVLDILEGGADALQLRDKRSCDRRCLERARMFQTLCEDYGVPFIVNDRPDIAVASGADGVHLGPEDLPIREVRELAPDLVIGGSAGTVERARALERAGANYLGSGAIYEASPSKSDASEPRGPRAIRAIVESVSIPVVGIGGIRSDNAASVIEAGATGIAVIRDVVTSEQPCDATRDLLEVVESARSRTT